MEDYRYELRARANRRKVGVDVNGLVLFLLAVANLAVIVVSVFGHHG